jgi:GMP synthase-like glutamine amidotransferase
MKNPENSLRVLLIDNQGGGGLERIRTRLLADHKIDIVPVWDLTPDHYDKHDFVVLSGGSRAKANTPESTYQHEIQLVRDVVVPVFGICLGMQVIAHAYEGELRRLEEARKGIVNVSVDQDDLLTDGLTNLDVYQNHKWAVTQLSTSLQSLGTSHDGIEIIRHVGKPIVGVQFHPERDGDFPTQGRVIFDRFMEQIVYEG